MKFKTLCACLSLVVYAGDVRAINLDSSFYNEKGDGSSVRDSEEAYWNEYKYNKRPLKKAIIFKDKHIVMMPRDLSAVPKNVHFQN